MEHNNNSSVSIPTIDFSPFTQPIGAVVGNAPTREQLSVGKDINQACRDTGFMFLQNIGLSEEELQSYFRASQSLFALPEDYKTKRLRQIDPVSNAGYTGFGSESLNKNRAPDLKEVRHAVVHLILLKNAPRSDHNFIFAF